MKKQPRLRDCHFFKKYLDVSLLFYQDLLGYIPEQTSLEQIPENKWNEFAEQGGLNRNSSGIYFPRNQTAIVRDENHLSLFHEYFGHGLYCEQSLTGRKLVDLEKRLLDEEKQEFNSGKFNLEDLQRFRKQNQVFQELKNFRQENLGRYELFAIWTEYLLSEENGLKDLFERKYGCLEKEDREAVDSVINFSNNYGNLATFYMYGLRKIQDEKRLLKLSQDLFGKVLDRARLILHFGSGKEFSDVDLFVISNDIQPIYSNNWIDIRAYNLNEVEDKIKLLEPKITFPVIRGKFIFGNKNYQEEIEKKIINQPITKEAINYNLEKASYHKKRFLDNFLGKDLQNKNLRSSKIYLTNALALKNGDKLLTFNELVDYSRKRFLCSEKFIELQGGIE